MRRAAHFINLGAKWRRVFTFSFGPLYFIWGWLASSPVLVGKSLAYVWNGKIFVDFNPISFTYLIVSVEGYCCTWSHAWDIHSLGFLWTNDRLVVDNPYLHITQQTQEKHPYTQRGLNPRFQRLCATDVSSRPHSCSRLYGCNSIYQFFLTTWADPHSNFLVAV